MITMGNENSILDECKFETKKIVEVGEWQLHHGTWQKNTNNYSNHNNFEQNSAKITLFERRLSPNCSKRELELHENATKYLKVFRHPNIVKYYHSGHRNNNDTLFLITERVEPLTRVLQYLSELEICAGLHSILQALVFCHEMCKARHNNFGMDSIYVTPNGVWKLSGMEFLCFQSNLDESFLEKNRAFRNESLIPPEEMEGKFSHLEKCGYAGDVYAVGLLIKCLLEIILKSEGLPCAKEFLEQIKKEVLIPDPTLRPPMRNLLNNKFFQNDFLEIHTFLMNLTLKSENEKENFFRTLAPRLFMLPEKLVATRLSDLLLSRFVLLDPAANEFFLPHFFRPYRESNRRTEFIEDQVNSLISTSLYVEHVIPKLKYIFEVLDINIRMILLTYFEHYVDLFSKEELTNIILPQILLGVRDINNSLVAISLRALSTLVPLLGSQVVIGGKRCQYFTEAKPKESSPVNINPIGLVNGLSEIIETRQFSSLVIDDANLPESSSEINGKFIADENCGSSPLHPGVIPTFNVAEVDVPELQENCQEKSLEEAQSSNGTLEEEDDEHWSDWDGVDNEDNIGVVSATDAKDSDNADNSVYSMDGKDSKESTNKILKSNFDHKVDLSTLKKLNGCTGLGEEFDVMSIEVKKTSSELNFFQDMQPLITKSSNVRTIVDEVSITKVSEKRSELSFAVDEKVEVTPNGWCEDLDWDEQDL